MQILVPQMVVNTTTLGIGVIIGHAISIGIIYVWLDVELPWFSSLKKTNAFYSITNIVTHVFMHEYLPLLGNGT